MPVQFQFRRGNTNAWTDSNPILAEGEMGIEITTTGNRLFKIGDGANTWQNLTYVGIQGTQGVQGNTGFQGIQGPQGLQGNTGFQGIQGRQGPQGLQGNTGFQGTSGTGTQGIQGPQGLQGNTGFQGTSGTGNQGVQGPQGLQGNTGFQGTSGTGNQGVQGPQGLQGNTGFQGTSGAGNQGTQGVQGIQGPLNTNALVANVQSFATVSEVNNATIDSSVLVIRTSGYHSAGDGGGAVYKRYSTNGTTPSHGAIIKSNATNYVWELSESPFNVKACGAKGDGSTEDTTAFQAAIDIASIFPSILGGVVRVPNGIYVIGTLNLKDRVVIEGESVATTILKAKNGLNADIIVSNNFSTLTNTNKWLHDADGMPSFLGLRYLQIDGNKANQTAGDGVKLYAKGLLLGPLLVRDCYNNGIYTEGGDKPGQTNWYDLPEGQSDYIMIRNCGDRTAARGYGWHMRGPHDIIIPSLTINECGLDGLRIERSTDGYNGMADFGKMHIYANGQRGIYSNTEFHASHCITESNYGEGMFLNDAWFVQIGMLEMYNNCRNTGNYQFLDTAGSAHCVINQAQITAPVFANTGGMSISGSRHVITGIQCIGNTATPSTSGANGIHVASTAQFNTLEGFISHFNAANGVGLYTNAGGAGSYNKYDFTIRNCANLWFNGATGTYNQYNIRGNSQAGQNFSGGAAVDATELVITNGATSSGVRSQIFIPGGAGAETPGLAFAANSNTGMHLPAAAQMTFVAGGQEVARFVGFPGAAVPRGAITIGSSNFFGPPSPVGQPLVQVNRTTDHAAYWVGNWGTSATVGPRYYLAKSKSGTVNTRGLVTNGDALGEILFVGDDGNLFLPAANIMAYVENTANSGNVPGRLVFSTTPPGVNVPVERMRITSTGRVGIGILPDQLFHVNSAIKTSGWGTIKAGNILFGQEERTSIYGDSNLLAVYAGTQERIRLTDQGTLGIGMTDPGTDANTRRVGISGPLVMSGFGENIPRLSINADSTSARILHRNSASLVFGTNDTERARIDSNGRVMVGVLATTTPTTNTRLEVRGFQSDTLNTDPKNANSQYALARFSLHNGNWNHLDIVGLRETPGADWTTAGMRIQSVVDDTKQAYIQFNGTGKNHSLSLGVGTASTAGYNTTIEGVRVVRSGTSALIGIGNVNPGLTLDVNGKGRFIGSLINGPANATIELRAPSGTAAQNSGIALWSTFANTPTDLAHRRAADITAGFSNVGFGAWGTEYLSFGVGVGAPNDGANTTLERARLDGNGYFGLGTTRPEAILDIQANSACSTTRHVSGIFRTNFDQQGNFSLRRMVLKQSNFRNSIQSEQAQGQSWGNNELILNPDGGNVGIACTSPSYQLTVTRTTGVDGDVTIAATSLANGAGIFRALGSNSGFTRFNAIVSNQNDNGYEHWYVGGNGVANTLVLKTNGGQERVRVDSDGNVMIGTTTSADRKFTVAGKVGISEAGGTGGRFTIATSSGGAQLYQNDNSPIQIGANVLQRAVNATQLHLNPLGPVTVNSNFSYTQFNVIGKANDGISFANNIGQVYLTNPDNLSGGLSLGYRFTSGVAEYGLIQAGLPASGSARDLILQPAGGNTGIGTISPITELHVTSNVASSNTLTRNTGQIFVNDSGDSSAGMFMGYRYDLGVIEYGLLQAGNPTSGAPRNIILQPGGGSVGVGYTATGNFDPSAYSKFTVLQQTGGRVAQFATTTNGAGFYWDVNNSGTQFQYSYGGTFTIGTSDSNLLSFATGGTGRMHIKGTDGNVGIGTTAPARMFDVTAGARVQGTLEAQALQFAIGDVNSNHLLYGVDANTIGIRVGNGSPAKAFSSIGTKGNTGQITIVAPSGGDLSLDVGGNYTTGVSPVTCLVLKSGVNAGKVGINTYNPVANLDVFDPAVTCTIRSRTGATSGDPIGTVAAGFGNGTALEMRAGLGYTYLLSTNTAGGASSPLLFGVGSEVARFTTTGNFGIGEKNPSTKLFVKDTNEFSLGATFQSNSAQTPILNHPVALFENSNTALGTGASIRFRISDTSGTLQTAAGVGAVAVTKGPSTVNSALYFYTAGAGTASERMRLDPNGNLGIGTTNPTQRLSVTDGIITIFSGTTAFDSRIQFGIGANTGWIGIPSWNPKTLRIFGPNGATGGGGQEDAASYGSNTWTFRTAGTARMTLIEPGRLGIGNTNPPEVLFVAGNIAATGTITASYSDIRLKEKIDNINNSIKIITSLNGFKYKNNDLAKSFGYDSDGIQIGLSAQEVKNVLPEIVSLAPFDMARDENDNLVSRTGNNYLTLDYAKMVPVLVEAIKEQQKIIERLVLDVEELKRR